MVAAVPTILRKKQRLKLGLLLFLMRLLLLDVYHYHNLH
jgi:hypothetical protein